MPERGINLRCRCQRDAPCAEFQLHLIQLRAHGGFAVRCQFELITLDKFTHPGKVVFDSLFEQHRHRQADVFTQDIPALFTDIAHARTVTQRPQPFRLRINRLL
ncbi:hypothetical protein SRABI106_04488 [Rahnella aquatilis]|nr:hypothetical protein SRABI106_04488 [Rahnella aquatilis]